MKKVTKKLEDKREQASRQDEGLMHPSIDLVSRLIVEGKLAESRGAKPIHERLHSLNQELMDKKL